MDADKRGCEEWETATKNKQVFYICFTYAVRFRFKPRRVMKFISKFQTLFGALALTVLLAGNARGQVTLRDFKLTGNLQGAGAAFTLTATAHVENSKGGTIDLLSGAVALTEIGPHPKWRVVAGQKI